MKFLSDYINEKQTELLNRTGTFFAFSKAQFEKQKKDGVEYVNAGMGMVCPKDKAKEVIEGLDRIAKEGMEQDLLENGKKSIIHRELGNHEYSYTYDISDTARALSGYGITEDEIRAEAKEYLIAFQKWEDEQEAKMSA